VSETNRSKDLCVIPACINERMEDSDYCYWHAQEFPEPLSVTRHVEAPSSKHVVDPVSLREMADDCERFNNTPPIQAEDYQRLYLRITRYAPRYLREAAEQLEQMRPDETSDDMQILRGIVNNQAAEREFLTVSMALLRRIVRAEEPAGVRIAPEKPIIDGHPIGCMCHGCHYYRKHPQCKPVKAAVCTCDSSAAGPCPAHT